MFELTTLTDDTDPEILHARWLVACQQLRSAFRWWTEAGSSTRAERYATVTAMMDQEAAAAAVYERAMRRQSVRPQGEATREASRSGVTATPAAILAAGDSPVRHAG